LWYNIKYNNLDLNPVKTLTNYREMYYMKRESEGIVIETSESIAKVRASRHEDCKSCGACAGDNAIVVDAKNPVGAKPGEHVVFEIEDPHMLTAAFIVYIFPLIAAFLGVLVGTWISGKLEYNLRSFQIGGGVIFFMLALIYVKIFDRHTAKKEKSKPVIKKILY
jgi:sigma-E factor negative regulatory protein RseC